MNQPDSEKKTAGTVDELREQVEHTREELAQTVEALSAKADVKARAQDKAEAAKQQAVAKAEELEVKAADAADQARARAVQVGRTVQAKTPEPVRHTTTQLAGQARSHPGLLVAGAAAAVITAWAVRRRRNG